MLMEMYSVYDRKMHEYQGIALAHNLPVFVRQLRVGLAKESVVCRYPADFEIHWLGRFDVSTGEIHLDGRPTVVAQVDQVLGPNGAAAPEGRENAAG